MGDMLPTTIMIKLYGLHVEELMQTLEEIRNLPETDWDWKVS